MAAPGRIVYPKAAPAPAMPTPAPPIRPALPPDKARPATRRHWPIICALLAVPLLAGLIAYRINRAPAPASAPPPPDAISAAPTPAPHPTQPAAAPNECLEALGSLSVAHLYQTHLNLGLLADGVESGAYTIAEAEESLKPVVDLMTQVDARLAKIAKSELPADDRRALEQVQAVSALMRLQADALRAYWAKSETQRAEDFQAARKASWDGLAKVMGIQ